MSLYIEWLNTIKEKSQGNWLTESQKHIYDGILKKWRAQPFINLYGDEGMGKTFICQILAKENGYFFTHDITNASSNCPQVIIDDAIYDRVMRTKASQLGIGRVLLISTIPVLEEAMPKVKLELGAKDIIQFQANLAKFCNITFLHTVPSGTNLTQILLRELIARGEMQHVN
jgi:hypothetical protein